MLFLFESVAIIFMCCARVVVSLSSCSLFLVWLSGVRFFVLQGYVELRCAFNAFISGFFGCFTCYFLVGVCYFGCFLGRFLRIRYY